MRMRWRGFELPGRVICDDTVSTDAYARFIVEPFEQGFGTTVGNSLRRVLLSSLEGAAITAVKIAGVPHEFTSIDGVLEDVTDILLNAKGIVVRYDGDEPKTMTVARSTVGEVRAGDIVADPAISIVNPEHVLATLTTDVSFEAEFRIGCGRGYATAKDNTSGDQELGMIPIDSVFSPVLRVRYKTESMRVGQRTNFDRLILDIWTNGSIRPDDALVEAGVILRKHLNPIVMYHELGTELVTSVNVSHPPPQCGDSAHDELLDAPISVLNFSARSSNCLETMKVETVRQLIALTEEDLLRFRSFGKTSLNEVKQKLTEKGLDLGSQYGEKDYFTLGGATGGDLGPNGVAMGGESDAATPPSSDGAGSSSSSASGPMAAFTMDD